ncbi:FG-GAP repeat protein [Thalassoglobus neptunius]|uniref:FG-GAP repeat protein n=2 Tax=Thalassoglobus neptunius TaxID=1938619 RepID=A0A5C5X3W1_9PLAN|nr:exo-alpha-sialidase [Thalassoglobus neptunius]TWT57269.1 FG-GAP repeat protein [Thalassoglobus neptunius]
MVHKQWISVLSWLALLMLQPLVMVGADSDWKLQPLPFNNPGLTVDLGVGLWAEPLPMDYDNDGDLDLVVSCPDKPSRGIYFFENRSNDPSVAMPVFKAGVLIAPTDRYMMLSMVDDEPVVMRPGVIFRRDADSGKFDFTKPERIAAPKNPHHRRGIRSRGNMWRSVDYDDDGDQDVLVGIGDWTELVWDHAYDNNGVWKNGPLHGYVYFVENTGTDAEPDYSSEPERLQANGGDLDVFGWPCPNFADFDGDGDLDLICGEFLDGFTYFENIGTRSEPVYSVGEKLVDSLGEELRMNLQMITPNAIDWDADGDLDLIVGDEDGRVAFVENTGELRDGRPVFHAPKYFQQEADTLKFGALATPFIYDWDSDGDEDIVCGNTAGEIALFENLGDGEDGLPKWEAPRLVNVRKSNGDEVPFRVMAGPNGSIQGPCEAKWGYTTLSVADWDGDGDGDIIYNSILGRIGLLINDSGTLVEETFDTGLRELPPAWDWKQIPSSTALTQWRTTPLITDFDEDGTLDLVHLDQEGYLVLRRDAGPAERIFVDEDGSVLRLNAGSCGRSGRVKLALVDWDQDGRTDLLVNSENATWYRNCETRGDKIVLKKIGNLAKRNVSGHTSSPTVSDFNKDGVPDLIVGSENGRIYHILHDDCETFPEDVLAAKPPQEAKEARIPGLVKEEFIYADAPFKECHASTICETSRGLVAAWFGGTKEGRDDVAIWTSYHDGLKWSNPTMVADGVQHDGLRYPCWNPVLYQPPGDAPTLLFFKVGPNPREWWGEMMVSYDRGRSFVERRRLPEGIDGPVRCKPILLDDGKTLLCGSSTEYDGWRIHFESIQLEDGQPSGTWSRVGPINDASKYNAIQPTFLQLPDGQLEVLCRTKEGVIVSSSSSDQGKSWSPLEPIDLPNPNSGIESVTLANGKHLLVYNPLSSGSTGWGKRGVLSLAISDNGKDWTPVADLEREEKSEFSYPAAIQSADGKVHIIYTWKRRRLKYLVIDPSDFK